MHKNAFIDSNASKKFFGYANSRVRIHKTSVRGDTRTPTCKLRTAQIRDVKLAAQLEIAKPSLNAKAPVTCSDADDQKFIDLAVAQRALLLSKDQHVLSIRKRLLAHGIIARAAM